jgi:hypothetical protein
MFKRERERERERKETKRERMNERNQRKNKPCNWEIGRVDPMSFGDPNTESFCF